MGRKLDTMAAQNGLTLRGVVGFGGRRPGKVERFELECDRIQTLRGRQRWVRVTAGGAWVTVTGLDLILYAGDTQMVDPGRHGAVVTSLDGSKLVFETWSA